MSSIVVSGNKRKDMESDDITMAQQLDDTSYPNIPFDLDCAAFEPMSMEIMSQVPSSQTDMMHFDNFQLPADPRFAPVSISAQSLSPLTTYRPLYSQFQEPQPDGAFESVAEEASPVTDESTSWKGTPEETQRAEARFPHVLVTDPIQLTPKQQKRRAQNRAAQRAYRQRKDQSLKQREKEVEELREELDEAHRLNQSLCKVVATLRQRLEEPGDSGGTTSAGS
jgi:hypothetical protein